MEGAREEDADVAVVGAGAVGLAAALAFTRAGFRTVLVGPEAQVRDGRTAALLDGSLRLLASLGLQEGLAAASAPLQTMRIVDDTASLFRPPPVEFRAAELGLPAFGRNVENARLVSLLAEAARAEPRLRWRTELASGLGGDGFDTVSTADGGVLRSRLVIAADGRRSRMRDAAGIAARERGYPQVAFTTILSHTRDHGFTSTEFHTRAGPATFVPLPGRRSSMVWVASPPDAERLAAMPDDGLAEAIRMRARSLLGAVDIAGPRGTTPLGALWVDRLVRGRLALVGEAAHALPPIGAQGLNLGMADVRALLDVALQARSEGLDIGGPAALARYEAARSGDVRMRTAAVDGLNRALLSRSLPIDLARGIGLGALARLGPIRRAVMRTGLMAPSGRTG